MSGKIDELLQTKTRFDISTLGFLRALSNRRNFALCNTCKAVKNDGRTISPFFL